MKMIQDYIAWWTSNRERNRQKTQAEIWIDMPLKLKWFFFFMFGAMTLLTGPIVKESLPLLITATDRASTAELLSAEGIVAWSCFVVFATTAAWSGFHFWGVTRLLQKQNFGV
ncbi:MAG: hypothetical protein IBJ12_03125 [Sphingomonadaceae bacterium]|nr:hypothetical protein [Sphingomonadaceae bacterium]